MRPGVDVGPCIAMRSSGTPPDLRLDGARRDVEAAGARAFTVPVDVADPDRVEAAAALIEETLGPIDVWVNDAMVTIFAPFEEITPEEYRRATEVTYLGTVWGTQAALN